ncbi:MAG: hypothetical protein R3E96_15965 [Planctomycetota bacterium]
MLIPTVHALRKEGIDYRGVLFVGLMMTDGGPRVIEYNVRFGDPECQAADAPPQVRSVPVLLACANGTLTDVERSPMGSAAAWAWWGRGRLSK